MAISYPPIFINTYLQQKLGSEFGAVPMFPSMPSDFNIADGITIEDLSGGGRFIFGGQASTYDRMFKMRRKAFPHIKDEQLLYYFYATREEAVPNLFFMTQKIQDLLDRGDESAEDLNTWVRDNMLGESGIYTAADEVEYLPVYFHDIKIYQLEETRDIIDFGTARTYAGNKIIIDYCYHTKGYAAGSNATYNDTTL
jgi:hypothetical protein